LSLKNKETSTNEQKEPIKIDPTCQKCEALKYCAVGRASKVLENCPMKMHPKVLKKAREIYEIDKDIKEITRVASIIEAKGYINWPRLKDTVEFAKEMGYKKLGLAFCVGLLEEARRVAEILEHYGFEVCGVCCKTGSVKKRDVDVPEEYIMISKTGYPIGWITCNPAAQALLLNEAKTDLNIIVGLCVGHDITFTKLSEAPVTTLIAKDRSTIHAPAAILFSSYGKGFFEKEFREMKKKSEN